MLLRRTIAIIVCLVGCFTAVARTANDSIPIDTLLLEDGSMYMGQIRDSLFNGQGTCIYVDGTVYQGEWKDGLWNGKGTLVYPDGDIYKGSFRNHIKEGKGVYVYNSGARYDGEWKNDRFNGKGTLRFEDGGIYDGEWKDDMKHGYGRLYSSTGYTSTGYFYYDEFLGLPFDTKIHQDTILTDELKAWGFENEPFSPHQLMSLGLSYGTTGMATVSGWVDVIEKHYFWGLSMGLNIEPPTKGVFTPSFGVNTYSNDIHFVGRYISSQYLIEAGYLFKKLSIGGSAGFGIECLYMNCKANGDPGHYDYYTVDYGEAYSRRYHENTKIMYRGYMRYSIHVKKQPKALLYLGYGKADGLFIGFGTYL